MSEKISKRIRREIKDKRPNAISKKDFNKIVLPSKKQRKAHREWTTLYSSLKKKYNSMGQKQKMEAWT